MTVFIACKLESFSDHPGGIEVAPWRIIAPALIISSLLLPVALLDMLLFSNRFAGPLLRLRRSLKLLAQGEEAPPLHLRKRDLLHDLTRDFNRVLERLSDGASNDQTVQSTDPCRQGAEASLSTRESATAAGEALVHSAD